MSNINPQRVFIFNLLIQMGSTVLLKWTPNDLMDASGQLPFLNNDNSMSQPGGTMANSGMRKISPASWQQAISINMATVLYIHCHQVVNTTTSISINQHNNKDKDRRRYLEQIFIHTYNV